jgi:hypothetical protein
MFFNFIFNRSPSTTDMLAWLHEAMAAERDLFQSLFESIGDSGVLVPLMLHKVFEGLLRPLRVRVEQAISTQVCIFLSSHTCVSGSYRVSGLCSLRCC